MPATSASPTLCQRLFAKLMAGTDEDAFEMYRHRKATLLSPLRGTVVELGPGTGVNLQFLNKSVQWIGIEPNPAMHPHIHGKADELGLSADIRAHTLAEAGLKTASVDAVISTLVLCSIPSLPQILSEIMTVLKPRGTFVFIEHVADRRGTFRRFVQKTAPYTPWNYFSDGCDPGRDIGEAIENAGFSKVDCEAYMQDGPGIIMKVNRPHISGVAVK